MSIVANHIAVEHIGKRYGRRTILQDISLSLQTRSVIGLLGANGAGKTTLFYIICGLVQPSHGKVLLDGQDITHVPMHQRARLGIGYLPQEASIFTHLSVYHNIASVAQLHGSDWRQRSEQLLADFNLSHVRQSLGYQLSGGERRRVEIARALAAKPKFILLDEPFAGVDPISINDTKQVVCSLADRGIGVIITDHNVKETLSICDHAYILGNGQLLAEGKADDIINNAKVRDSYLGADFQL